MALSEIKTNTPKQGTKDEPQTDDSYKIRQIIIKIMEYIHICIYIYTYEQNQNSPTNIKYNRLTQGTKEIKNCTYQLGTKLKHKLENKIKARCQVGNRAMKTKLTNML